jgi:hypothetical protein
MDTNVLDHETEFEVTNIGQLHWLLGIQITVNCNSIEHLQEAFLNKILEQSQMNHCHLTLLLIDLNTSLTTQDSVLDAEEPLHYQSIIGSCMYLVTYTRLNCAYPISYFYQSLTAPSKSHLTPPKYLLGYITDPLDIKLSFLRSNASEIMQKGYSDYDFRHCLDT